MSQSKSNIDITIGTRMAQVCAKPFATQAAPVASLPVLAACSSRTNIYSLYLQKHGRRYHQQYKQHTIHKRR